MTDLACHDGTVRQSFGLAIRGQLVDFQAGARVEAADQAMRDAIEAAGADVEWDDETTAAPPAEADTPPRRRGRPPKV